MNWWRYLGYCLRQSYGDLILFLVQCIDLWCQNHYFYMLLYLVWWVRVKRVQQFTAKTNNNITIIDNMSMSILKEFNLLF